MIIKKILSIAVLICCLLNVSAQNYTQLTLAKNAPVIAKNFAYADSLSCYYSFDIAEKAYNDVLQKFPNDKYIKYYVDLSLLDIYIRNREIEKASTQIEKINSNRSIDSVYIDELHIKAKYHLAKGNYDTSEYYYEKIKPIYESDRIDKLLYGSFLIDYGLFKYSARTDIKKSLKIFLDAQDIWLTEQDDLSHIKLFHIYFNLSRIYLKRNEESLLKLYADKADKIANELENTLPLLKLMIDFMKAEYYVQIEQDEKSCQIMKDQLIFGKKNNIDEFYFDYTYNNISDYALNADQIDTAYYYNQILLKRLEKLSNSSISYKRLAPIAIRRQAICLEKLNQPIEAEKYYLKAIKLNAENYGMNSRRYGQSLKYYSIFLRNQNRFDEAIRYVDSSIVVYNERWLKNDDESHLLGLMLCQQEKGMTYDSLYKKPSDKALQTYLKAASYMKEARERFYIEESELDFSSTQKPIFESIISTANSLFKATRDSSYLEYIYYAIESNKYQTLWQKINERKLYDSETINDIYIDSLISLNSQLENLNDSLKNNDHLSTDIKLQIVKIKEIKENLIKSNFPNAIAYKEHNYKDVQRALNKNSTILQLFDGDEKLYIVMIQKNKIEVFDFKYDAQYINELSDFKSILAGRNLSNPLTNQLSEYLNYASKVSKPFNECLRNFNFIDKNNQSLTIIPDGKFTSLPFETLVLNTTKNQEINSFSDIPFWIKKFDINYNIAAKWFLEKHSNNNGRKLKNIIAIGPKRSAILLGAEKEIKNISSKFGNRSKSVFSNQREFIKKSTFNDEILHIACHAVIDSTQSNLSFLHFGSNLEDSLKLYDYEISNLNFDLPLVVLNACETFKGAEYKGEGIYNLNQSFILGGAESVISTLWRIEDNSASLFMGKFYTNLNKGNSINESVNSSKKLMIKDDITAHPFYWAAFLYNGDAKATYHKKTPIRNMLVLGILLILALTFKFKLRNKRLN